jgi:uncharacterized protein
MGMVALEQRIASAYVIAFGEHGDITQQAQEWGVSRQRVYREHACVIAALAGTAWQREKAERQHRLEELEERNVALAKRLSQAVVLDKEKQKEFASVAQAVGVSLPTCQILLEVLLGKRAPKVSTLGRWTKAAGKKAGELLAVLDEFTCDKVKQAVADEIYTKKPVLMVLEPESLCWVSGRLVAGASGAEWTKELAKLPQLQQVTRDAGTGLSKAVADLNQQRAEQGLTPVADQLDHFHTLREGGRVVGQAARQASAALKAADKAEAEQSRRRRHGQSTQGTHNRVRFCWAKADKAMNTWQARDEAWQKVKEAVQLVTPEGELNSRARAEAALAVTLPQLPDTEFAKAKRLVQQPQTLTYLDEVHRKLQALPVPAEIREAAIRQETLGRRPELLQGDNAQAAALRGLLMICVVILAKAGAVGQHAVAGVRNIFRNTWRASSLVECLNSTVRMQQARHRKMTQGLLDLKRLYWNTHTFRTGRRRGASPYQRLGLPWPEGLRWWDLLKWTPEQLRDQLSALENPE